MEKYDVILYDLIQNTETHSTVYADEGEISDEIVLRIMLKNISIIAKSECYLSAYQELRDELLINGFGLKCNGSCINATQSAIIGYIPQIYLVKIGKQALNKDIVSIWDYCDINAFPDTKQQNQYIERWFESLSINSDLSE